MKDHSKKIVILASIVLSMIPATYAIGITQSLSKVGQVLVSLTRNYYIMYIAAFIFIFIILYGAFAAGLSRVSAFGDSKTLNQYGKKVAIGLSLLSSAGMVWGFRNQSELIIRVMTQTGWFGIIVLAVLPALLVYNNFKNKEGKKDVVMAIAAAGFGIFMYGLFTQKQDALNWGITLMVIFGIWALIRGSGGSGGAATGGNGNTNNNTNNNQRGGNGNNQTTRTNPNEDPDVAADFVVEIRTVRHDPQNNTLTVEGTIR